MAFASTGQSSVANILTVQEPFGPRDSEELFNPGRVGTEVLFDRTNLIYAQAVNTNRPTYIVGRKGAGKTAFLRASSLIGDQPQVCLDTAGIYSEMAGLLKNHARARGPIFVSQTAQIWSALFEHVALLYACNTATPDDPASELQVLYDYLAAQPDWQAEPATVAGHFLAELTRRIDDRTIHGLDTLIDGMTRGGISFAEVRPALKVVLASRPRTLMIVMDNLEDLHTQLDAIRPVLAGLFHAVGQMAGAHRDQWPFSLQICLPSELWDQLHVISANPEKDFGKNFLTIFWTANELLHLAATRFRLFMELHHPQQLEFMRRTSGTDEALLRAALPATFRNGLGIEENPVAYLMRHTQLLPRHLIVILNSVFTASVQGSQPWAITESAMLVGTREGEEVITTGILAAHSLTYPHAKSVLRRMSNRLNICFEARELHKVFNQEGIKKQSGLDYDEFLDMLITIGVIGVKIGETARYHNAEFQYTFATSLNAKEDSDHLCFHPLFTRSQFEHSLKRLRSQGERPTYPYGTDTSRAQLDYRSLMSPYASRIGGS